MVSAGNKQNRLVTVVGALREELINNPVRGSLDCLLTMRSLGEPREQTCGWRELGYLQQPNDLRAGLAAPEGHNVTTD